MATNLLELLKSSVTPDMITKLSSLTGGNSSNVQSAVNTILPTMLGSLVQKTSTESGASDVMKLIKDGGYDGSLLNNLGGILDGGKDKFDGLIKSASPILNSLFGNKLSDVTNTVSRSSGLESNVVSTILAFLAPIVMNVIGKFVKSENLNAGGLSNLMSEQKNYLSGLIPAGLSGILGFGSPSKSTSTDKDNVEKVSESGFKKILPWLLAALLAILLLWWWRGCDKDTAPVTKKTDTVKTDVSKKVEMPVVQTPKTGDSVMDSINATLGNFIRKKLSDGSEIIIAEKGVEGNLLMFIEDKSKMADKETWFSFDRILFETNKATLRPSSGLQLANIAAIMKAYPNVEIKIGGYTDNTGNANANMKLSQQRANSVMAELVKLGVAAARMKAEGYGDQFPVASNDTPEGRAKNRRIDVRVSKK